MYRLLPITETYKICSILNTANCTCKQQTLDLTVYVYERTNCDNQMNKLLKEIWWHRVGTESRHQDNIQFSSGESKNT